jgi:uncharacterized membrane protein YeaQ/YmgE (transglycosylase-associated protein family)
MSILVWFALGLVGGGAAGWVWGDRGRVLLGDITVGVLGACLGGFMASVTLGLNITDLDFASLLAAGVGAAILILVLHAVPASEVFE